MNIQTVEFEADFTRQNLEKEEIVELEEDPFQPTVDLPAGSRRKNNCQTIAWYSESEKYRIEKTFHSAANMRNQYIVECTKIK